MYLNLCVCTFNMFGWENKYVVNSNQSVFRVWNGCILESIS